MTRIFVVLSMSIKIVALYTQKTYQYCEVNWVVQRVIIVGTFIKIHTFLISLCNSRHINC